MLSMNFMARKIGFRSDSMLFPDHLKKAFLATEDRDFYNHYGFDIRGIARAVVVNISAGKVRQGASTIT